MVKIVLIISLIVSQLWAQEVYKKTISFDWDLVPGAVKYEVKFTNYKNGTPVITSQFTSTNSYYGAIPPGYYKMSLRSLDKRNVPGVWSEEVEFPVLLDKVKVSLPNKENVSYSSQNEDYQEVDFVWSPVLGADKYQLVIRDIESGKALFENYFTESATRVNLPVGAKYNWSVTALDNSDLKSDAETTGEITVFGAKLKKPVLETPENQFVREIKWIENTYAANYAVELQKYNPSTKKWESKVEEKSYKSNKISFDDKWPGGQYRIVLQAKGNLRADSDKSVLNFKVKNGDRSIAAEYTYVLRKSIDRINGLYANASWLLSMVNYSSSYKGLNPKYNVFGGTARMGLGWFQENNPIGYFANWDISGFLKDESYMRSFVYHSMSGSVIYRKTVRTTDEFRVSSGLFYKEIPQTIADLDEISSYFVSNNRSINGFKGTSNQVISMAGPQVGLEYWFSLTPKLGFQVNAQWYYSMMAVKLPNNGKSFKPTLSDQYGVMGSYKVNNKFTGLLGLAYKKDQAAYKDDSTSGGKFQLGSADALYDSNTDVSTSINGFYLSMFAEYAF
jgi:hypothetical protein